MKIGHFTPEMTYPGGINIYIERVAEAQRAAGHDVTFLSVKGATPAGSPSDARGTEGFDTLWQRCAEMKIDVVHTHCALDEPPPAGLAVVRTVHGHEPYCPSGTRFLREPGVPCPRRYTLLGCAFGHVVNRCGSIRPGPLIYGFRRTQTERRQSPKIPIIAVSSFVRSQMIRSGASRDDIHVILNPAPAVQAPAEATSNSEPPRFLFAGRLTVSKGAHWFLNAAAVAKHDIRVDIAGIGPQEDELRRLVDATPILKKRVMFHGWVTRERAMDLIANARAAVVPSVWHEPAGLVALEAAASGRAVIASDVGGIREYTDALGNALLVPSGDVAELARRIDELAVEPATAADLGRIGRAHACEKFGLQRHVEALEQVYGEARRRC